MHPDDAPPPATGPPPVVHRELDPLFNVKIRKSRLVLIILGIVALVALCAVVTALSATSPDHGRAMLVP
jgi:hypothetical protein